MITLSAFIGEIPSAIPRLLPDSGAQIAKNCKLVDGSIAPMRFPADYRTLANDNVMFYKLGDTWFEYNKIVDVVRAPIAKNRLYITGDGTPKIVIDNSEVYDLAVKPPQAPLTASVTGDPDPTTQSTIAYAYTYVTATDDESEPSPLSNEVVRSSGMEVTLKGFANDPTLLELQSTVAGSYKRDVNRIRIYRTQTSASGATSLYLIAEHQFPVPTDSAPYTDMPEETPIQETIPTLSANPPPEDLQGIIALPNGIMAGFTGNKLYFSEAWKPHSWPENYVLTTSFDIVGLGAFGRSIAIMTKGNPYIASGITPDAMAMELIEVNYPCVSKRGIVDLGYSVAYPSTDGLVIVSAKGAELATRNIFTRAQWQELSPETMIASQFDGRYILGYSYTDKAGVLQQGTIIIDLTGKQPFITRTDMYFPYMYFEVGAGKLYVLNGQRVQEWDSPKSGSMQMTWRSKKIVLDGHINLGASMVDADPMESAPAATPSITVGDSNFVSGSFSGTVVNGSAVTASSGAEFQATIYADGNAVRTFTDLNTVARLPGGFLARTWEIEITGRRTITSIYAAWSPSELYVGAK